VSYNEVVTTQGMDITIVTTARDDREGYALLKALGFPFKD
jgi:large subunit ribosomal protein L5